MSTWIILSVVALLPVIIHLRKHFSPLRVSAKDSKRFAGAFSGSSISTFTGRASESTKRSDSHTSGKITSNMGSGADGLHVQSVQGSVNTTVTVTDSFFLTDQNGQVQSFQLSGFDVHIGSGQLVSVAWVTKRFKKKGPYFFVYNHTTRQSYFHDTAIRKTLTAPYPSIYMALLILMILPIPVIVIVGLAEVFQRRQFKRSGIQPLVDELNRSAAKFDSGHVQSYTNDQLAPVGIVDKTISSSQVSTSTLSQPSFCSACGTQFFDLGKFCASCGSARPA